MLGRSSSVPTPELMLFPPLFSLLGFNLLLTLHFFFGCLIEADSGTGRLGVLAAVAHQLLWNWNHVVAVCHSFVREVIVGGRFHDSLSLDVGIKDKVCSWLALCAV
jgi:hypothetical protein